MLALIGKLQRREERSLRQLLGCLRDVLGFDDGCEKLEGTGLRIC